MRNEQNWNVLGGERQVWGKDLSLRKCATVKRNVGAGLGGGGRRQGEVHLAATLKPIEGTYMGGERGCSVNPWDRKKNNEREVKDLGGTPHSGCNDEMGSMTSKHSSNTCHASVTHRPPI